MLNRRKKLLKREKNLRTQAINEEIKALNLKIKHFLPKTSAILSAVKLRPETQKVYGTLLKQLKISQ